MELDILIQEPRNDIKLPELSELEKKKIDKIDEMWKNWRLWFESNHKDRVRENLRRIHAVTMPYDDPEDMWRGVNGSPIRFALEYAIAETYKSRILKGILGTQDIFKILPKRTSKDKGKLEQLIDNAKLMEKTIRNFLEEDNWTQKIINLVDQLATQSACPWMVYQMQAQTVTTKEVAVEKPVLDAMGNQIATEQGKDLQQVTELVENRPVFDMYDIENVAFNYTMGVYEKSPWYIIRQIMHRSELSKAYPEYKEYFDSGLLDWDLQDDFISERAQEIGINQDPSASINIEGKIEVYYYLEPEGVVVVFGRRLIKEIPNPSKAHKKEVFTGLARLFPTLNDVYGRDLVQLGAMYSDLWNELINIEVDNAKLAGNMVIKVKTNAGVQMDTIFIAPGNQWLMDDIEAVQTEDLKHQVGTSFNLLKVISEKDQQIHGATNTTMGTKADAEFATDINRMQIEANLRFWLALVNLRIELSKIIRAYVKHIQEFIVPTISEQSPFSFLMVGDTGYHEEVEIKDGSQLLGDFNYRISFDIEDVDRNVIRAQLLQAVMIISKSPILAPVTNPDKLLEIIFKMFPNIKEMEELGGSVEQQLSHILGKLSSQQLTALLTQMDALIQAKQQQEMTASTKQGKGAKPSGGKLDTIATSGSKIGGTSQRSLPANAGGMPAVVGGNKSSMPQVAGMGA